MNYRVGDIVQLKNPHSEGDHAKIYSIVDGMYKIYIPYWDYFMVSDEDIVGVHPEFTEE